MTSLGPKKQEVQLIAPLNQPESAVREHSPGVTLNTLATFLEYPPDALLVIDSTGTIVLGNTQAETLFGYSHDELPGQPVECLIPEHLRAIHVAQRTHYLQQARARPMGVGLDLMAQRKDGSRFPVDISLRPVRVEQAMCVMAAIRDMTAQRALERERIQISQRLHQQDKLISLAHDAILVRDPADHIVSWNEGAEHLYGWTAQEAIGHAAHVLLQAHVAPTPVEPDHILEQHGQWQGELTHTCRDGTQVIVESRQVLVRDDQGKPSAILEINRDITERRRMARVEQEMRAEKEARLQLLQVILDHLPGGVFLVQGPPLRLLLANRAASALWGTVWPKDQPQEEFLRQRGIGLFTANGRPLAPDDSPARRAMISGEPVLQHHLVFCQPDGTRLPLLVDAIPLEHVHLPPRFPHESALASASPERVVLVVYRDVTALEEAEALKDQFVSLATHELRTPVTVIAGYADYLLSRAAHEKGHLLDEWQRKKMQEMKQSAHHVALLTEDLLDVTRVQTGQFYLERQVTDLVTLTRQVITQLQATTSRHHLSFHTTLSYLWATVDTLRIEQVLSNLLSNAIKYSPAGGPIEVTLEEQTEQEATSSAHFLIHDQGIGIPQDQQAHLFGRFVRAENARATGIRGTGLGLYLCRELIERHGGHISFESEEGVGSTFFFSLPCTGPTSA